MRTVFIALGLISLLANAGMAQAGENACDMNMDNMSHNAHMSKYTQAYMKSMCDMMVEMGKYRLNGDASHDFAASMIPHHKAAVEMAKTLLQDKNADSSLRKMAENIISSQSKEIEELETYLKSNP
jgi:uncharacterized protein (DUF305 family)